MEEVYDAMREHCLPRTDTETATMTDRLKKLPVLLSASVPDSVRQGPRALTLYDTVTLLVRRILAANGRVIFGGHPSIVPLVHRAARETGASQAVVLYLLRRFQDRVPPEIYDLQVFDEVHWIGDGSKAEDQELAEMRDAMIHASRAAVFIGGKTRDFHGAKPGIRDEYERFTRRHANAPVYLLGLLDGETARMIDDLKQTGRHEPNTLSETDRDLLYRSADVDLIAPVVVADLERTAGRQAGP